MDRLIGVLIALLGAAVVLPALAATARAAVPVLLTVLALLVLAKLIWPGGRR